MRSRSASTSRLSPSSARRSRAFSPRSNATSAFRLASLSSCSLQLGRCSGDIDASAPQTAAGATKCRAVRSAAQAIENGKKARRRLCEYYLKLCARDGAQRCKLALGCAAHTKLASGCKTLAMLVSYQALAIEARCRAHHTSRRTSYCFFACLLGSRGHAQSEPAVAARPAGIRGRLAEPAPAAA